MNIFWTVYYVLGLFDYAIFRLYSMFSIFIHVIDTFLCIQFIFIILSDDMFLCILSFDIYKHIILVYN